MPKHTRTSSSGQHRYPNPIPVLAPSQNPQDYQPRLNIATMPTTYYQTVPSTSQAAMQAQAYDAYSPAVVPPAVSHRPSSGAWSLVDDQNLQAARAQGLNWSQIQQNYFPNKTANACRKRHERLMERKGADDWDNQKFERIAKEYMTMRKEIWQPLAARTGEKWSVVESKCMSNGLKNLQSAARSASRRERLEAGQSLQGYDDDSGISGVGLTPIDDLDPYHDSPEASSSSGGSATHQGGYGGITIHPSQMGHHQTYGQNYLYGSSHSSSSSQGYAMAHHSAGGSPYMGHGQRLPSVDMGIGAIINREASRM